MLLQMFLIPHLATCSKKSVDMFENLAAKGRELVPIIVQEQLIEISFKHTYFAPKELSIIILYDTLHNMTVWMSSKAHVLTDQVVNSYKTDK